MIEKCLESLRTRIFEMLFSNIFNIFLYTCLSLMIFSFVNLVKKVEVKKPTLRFFILFFIKIIERKIRAFFFCRKRSKKKKKNLFLVHQMSNSLSFHLSMKISFFSLFTPLIFLTVFRKVNGIGNGGEQQRLMSTNFA